MNIKHFAAIAVTSIAFSTYGAESLTLTFQRSGTALSDVAVTANIAGVTASLTSLSHAIKNVSNTIICADINGSSSPTIVYNFSIAGLPAEWTFNNVGLDIHALNGAGVDQQNNDNKKRQFNVSVTSGAIQLVSYTDLDPAAGVENVRKVWDAATATTITPTNPYELTITVTKGAENSGCFFGLEGITLSTVDSETPEPPAPTPGTSKFYTIKWKNNTQNYITEQHIGTLTVGQYSVNNKIFWEFIPTDKESCYYIKSAASGKYIGSCNMEASSNSRVMMSDDPVEYYVHLSASDSGENQGCYWLSSTDCANYDNESESARCLNKDGASNYIITWSTGVGNKGSYWTLTETENLYEQLPARPIHTPYALSHQLYQLPCGAIGDTWISQVTIGNDFHYPMANKDMTYPTITAKPGYYNILTRDAAAVSPGSEAHLKIQLNKAPAQGYKLYLYVDYDRDGLFEYAKELQCVQNIEETISIPKDTKLGRTRLRLRLTNANLEDADDDVYGEVLDLLLNITEATEELIAPVVKVNDATRGDAEWSDGIAKATSKGNALFLYWSEGNRICSVEPEFAIASTNTPRTLTAFFTVNTEKIPDGGDQSLLNKIDVNSTIVNDGEVLKINDTEVIALMVFSTNGHCVAFTQAQCLNITTLPEGIYIAKAITVNGTLAAKIKK